MSTHAHREQGSSRSFELLQNRIDSHSDRGGDSTLQFHDLSGDAVNVSPSFVLFTELTHYSTRDLNSEESLTFLTGCSSSASLASQTP